MREERGKGGSQFCFMDAQNKKKQNVLANESVECNASLFQALINYFLTSWSGVILFSPVLSL